VRRAAEKRAWSELKKRHKSLASDPLPLAAGTSVELGTACLVLGGRNGAGKSRVLRQAASVLGESAVFIDLHHLVEQALTLLRSRADLDEMANEAGVAGPDLNRLGDVQKIVGREYDEIEWFALELVPDDEVIAARFRWSLAGSSNAGKSQPKGAAEGETNGQEDQDEEAEEPDTGTPLVPYFRASYRGHSYSALEMGLGEFSVHFLFWILEQYRDESQLVLLLDEPDAYLPPVGVQALLTRILKLCDERRWRVLVTSHSEELIQLAVENEAFTLLRTNDSGLTIAEHSAQDSRIAERLVPHPTIDALLFVEDESAHALTAAVLQRVDRGLARRVAITWGNGHGYLRELVKHVPAPPKPEMKFAFVFDGDQRSAPPDEPEIRHWPAVYLPTEQDPDELFRDLRSSPDELSARLGTDREHLERVLESLEGSDAHDWVNDLGDEFGRPLTLHVLSTLWVEQNAGEAEAFVQALRECWS
jgi:hypothetical protein